MTLVQVSDMMVIPGHCPIGQTPVQVPAGCVSPFHAKISERSTLLEMTD